MVEYSNLIINLLSAFLIIILGLIMGQIVSNIIKRFLKGTEINKVVEDQLKIKLQVEKYLSSIIKYVIYILAIIFALNALGISARILQIIVIIIIIAIILFIVLAFKDWLPDLVSGFYIIKTRKIKKGDIITNKDIKGKVIQINLLETKIETNKKEIISIPNHNITKYGLTKKKNG